MSLAVSGGVLTIQFFLFTCIITELVTLCISFLILMYLYVANNK